jgi:hypothetical protein
MQRSVVLLAALIVAGCSDSGCDTSTAPCAATTAFAETLNGQWQATRAPSGQRLDVRFTTDGVNVLGAGHYTDGGRTGLLDVRGEVEWIDVQRDFVMLPPHAELSADIEYSGVGTGHLDQTRLFGTDTLRGVLTFAAGGSSTSYIIELVRIR